MSDLIDLYDTLTAKSDKKRQRRKLFIEKFTPLDEVEIPSDALKLINLYNELSNLIWSGTNGQIPVGEMEDTVKQGLDIKNEIIKLWEER